MSPPGETLILGTRGSALALVQSNLVRGRLEASHPGLACELRIVATQGDQNLESPLPEIGGKGVFTAEIESALLSGAIDLAVHSLKDLPTGAVDGLAITAIPEREDPRDAVIIRAGAGLADLAAGASVGTSSLRRGAQLLAFRGDLKVLSIRGNVDTRLRKLDRGEYDAIVLAVAGLRRLGLQHRISELLSFEVMLPAPGQGALAVQCRSADARVQRLCRVLDHAPTRRAVTAERAFLQELGGGCSAPIAAYAAQAGQHLDLQGLVSSPDGRRVLRMRLVDTNDTLAGVRLGRQMLERGAREMLS